MLNLEMAVNDAIFRIRRDYERTKGKIFLSFSGGKDSTVLAELIKMADLPTKIPFVFANTRIEFDATLRFVKNYDYENIVIVQPRKPFGQILKEYGKPVLSKIKSNNLSTYQKHMDNPLDYHRARVLITGEREAKGVKSGERSRFALPDKYFHFLHPDLEYKIANMCCTYMKKYPFDDYAKENDMNGTFTGVRVAEGGARATTYKSCVQIKKKNGKDFIMSMPLFDWPDELVDEFVKKYNVKLSDAYTVYGCERTGCVGCPYGRNIEKELEMTYKYEPNRYKAAIKWLGDVYIDQGVRLEFDPEYMKRFEARWKINEKRREEMLKKFEDVRLKNKTKPKQMTIYDYEE